MDLISDANKIRDYADRQVDLEVMEAYNRYSTIDRSETSLANLVESFVIPYGQRGIRRLPPLRTLYMSVGHLNDLDVPACESQTENEMLMDSLKDTDSYK